MSFVLKGKPSPARDECFGSTNVRSASICWESGMDANLSERTMMDGCLDTASHNLKEVEEAFDFSNTQ